LTKFNIQQMVPAPINQAGLASTVGQPFTLSEKREHQAASPTLFRKLLREGRRINEKWLYPLWLMYTRRCRRVWWILARAR